jgi:hypothetical protein
MYKILLTVLLLILPSIAEAAYCGKDSGLSCPAPDADGDGFTTDGTLAGYDCDDSNWQMYPGVWRFNAGAYSVCQTNGSYSPAITNPTAKSGSGGDYFVDCDAASNGTGTFASPWNTLKYIMTMNGGNRPAGWHSLIAGDAVFVAGTCDESIDAETNNTFGRDYVLYLAGVSGTALNPVKFLAWPGKTRGHFKSLSYKEKIAEIEGGSTYVELWGLEISGLADYGMNFAESSNIQAHNMYIHDVDGEQTNNNSGAVFSGSSNSTLSHSLLLNNYDRQKLSGGVTLNTRNIVMFQGTENTVAFNVVKMTNPEILGAEYGAGIGYKHGDTTTTVNSTFELHNNVIIGSSWAIETGEAGTHAHHNYAEFREHCFSNDDVGGPFYPVNTLFEYNTCIGPSLVNTNGFSADAVALNNIFRKNILVANVAAYNYDRAVILDTTYGDNALYDIHANTGAFDYSENCYYNTGAGALQFNFFNGGESKGGTYTFAQWQVADVSGSNNKPAWDDDSFNENPVLNSISNATSLNCLDKGYLANLSGGGILVPTPTPIVTPTPAVSSFGSFVRRICKSCWR